MNVGEYATAAAEYYDEVMSIDAFAARLAAAEESSGETPRANPPGVPDARAAA